MTAPALRYVPATIDPERLAAWAEFMFGPGYAVQRGLLEDAEIYDLSRPRLGTPETYRADLARSTAITSAIHRLDQNPQG